MAQRQSLAAIENPMWRPGSSSACARGPSPIAIRSLIRLRSSSARR